jgi:TrmH family RNA methyltransferase
MENLRVVLVAPRNPLNIGAVARAMSNFGAMHLRVVKPYELAWREAKSAVGAAELLSRAEETASVGEAVADSTLVIGTTAVGNRDIRQPLHGLAEAAPLLRKRMQKRAVALLFGSEKWGLSNESLSHCHWLLRIPTRAEHRSMNLGQAVAVCLYELARGRNFGEGAEKQTQGPTAANALRSGNRGKRETQISDPTQPVTMEVVDRITAALLKSLHTSGYISPEGRETAEEKLRRMIRRFELKAGDAEVFLGMLHKISSALERG